MMAMVAADPSRDAHWILGGRRWWLWWDPGVGDVGGNNGDGDEIYVNPHPSFRVVSPCQDLVTLDLISARADVQVPAAWDLVGVLRHKMCCRGQGQARSMTAGDKVWVFAIICNSCVVGNASSG
ncbi:hypothetical protein BDA96_K000500 [Sorghum bicolor]|uniref:Uncharacterized protein n=1 Tax=Sorghum bicolor TaxID=4558 RepID=A0A921TX23_SORBI|nr:hypothetical protein BDA96_K000500 [Sorghum bicolor]